MTVRRCPPNSCPLSCSMACRAWRRSPPFCRPPLETKSLSIMSFKVREVTNAQDATCGRSNCHATLRRRTSRPERAHTPSPRRSHGRNSRGRTGIFLGPLGCFVWVPNEVCAVPVRNDQSLMRSSGAGHLKLAPGRAVQAVTPASAIQARGDSPAGRRRTASYYYRSIEGGIDTVKFLAPARFLARLLAPPKHRA